MLNPMLLTQSPFTGHVAIKPKIILNKKKKTSKFFENQSPSFKRKSVGL